MCSVKNKSRHEEPEHPIPPDERIVMKNLGGQPSISVTEARAMFAGIVEPRKMAFLLALSQLGNRQRAAKASDISAITVHIWRRDDDCFRKAYEKAMVMAAELMESELVRRACEGVLKPVFQGGRLVGSVREYSDTLLIFGLKGAMPDKYADRQKVEHSGQLDIVERLKAARQRASEGKKR